MTSACRSILRAVRDLHRHNGHALASHSSTSFLLPPTHSRQNATIAFIGVLFLTLHLLVSLLRLLLRLFVLRQHLQNRQRLTPSPHLHPQRRQVKAHAVGVRQIAFPKRPRQVAAVYHAGVPGPL